MTLVEIELRLPDWTAARDRINATIPGLIAATVQTQRGLIFDNEGAYNGRQRWAGLKCRTGQILKRRGTLSQSIGPRNDGDQPAHAVGSIVRMTGGLEGVVAVGTSIAYAAVHNYGATIRPVRAKALRFQCGNTWVFRRKVTIPARPFADWTSQDTDELVATIENRIAAILGEL